MKILIVLQIFKISFRSARIFLLNHEEYLHIIGISEMPSFQVLPRRSRSLDLHAINREITSLYSIKNIAAVDSFMVPHS